MNGRVLKSGGIAFGLTGIAALAGTLLFNGQPSVYIFVAVFSALWVGWYRTLNRRRSGAQS